MAETDDALRGWLKKLNDELDRRMPTVNKLDRYFDGDHPPPNHVKTIRAETEYKELLAQAVTNWPELIVSSVKQRLAVTGFRFADEGADSDVWDLWQRNALDARSGLVHEATLVNGRAFAIVWSDGKGGVKITPEHASTTVVAYATDGHTREAALRRWQDGSRWYCTLYLPTGIYKFQGPEKEGTVPLPDKWERRQPGDESWPLANPLRVVPVVEFAVNRSLRPAAYGTARGEFQRVTPIIDRINTTIFCGLLAQAYASFPVRALIGVEPDYEPRVDSEGDPVLDENNEQIVDPVSPINNLAVDRLITVEDPDAKFISLPESNLKNYIEAAESHVRHLAAITQTPAHYLLGEMVNLSADAIRAAEAGLISKISGHKIGLGESWEEVMRLALRVLDPDDPRGQQIDGETLWKSSESRSLAEQADAATKLQTILPGEAVWERLLDATPQEMARWRSLAADAALTGLLAAPPPPEPAPA